MPKSKPILKMRRDSINRRLNLVDEEKENLEMFLNACERGDLENVKKYFLSVSYMIEKIPDEIIKVLVNHEYLEIISFLLENRKSFKPSLEFNLRYEAILQGNFTVVKFLFDREGGDESLRYHPSFLRTALLNSNHINTNIVRYIISRADSEALNQSVLYYAIELGNLAAVKVLIGKCGINPNSTHPNPNRKYNTVETASLYGKFPIVRYLVLSRGASETNIRREYRDRLNTIRVNSAKKFLHKLEDKLAIKEADVTTQYGKRKMEESYKEYQRLVRDYMRLQSYDSYTTC